jgi:hypothetical protein
MQAHRNFLFTKDYAAISLVMLVAFGIVGNISVILAGYFAVQPFDIWSIVIGIIYFVGLILQYLLTVQAARNYGVETVTDAIAAWLNK